MAVRFYGDESQDRQEQVLTVAGFIGFADEWERLQEKWIARVKPTGVSAYHMMDCESGWGDFRGWPKPDRDNLTIDLIEMICQHQMFLIGFGILLDDYKTLAPINQAGESLGHDEWHSAFQGLLRSAALAVGDEAPSEETIEFFFDWKMKQGVANKLFEEAQRETRLPQWRKRLGTLTFGHKEFDVPGSLPLLQIADIAAVEARKALANPITHPHLSERKSYARLKEAKRVWSVKCLDKPVLDAMREHKRQELGLPHNLPEAWKRLEQLDVRRKIAPMARSSDRVR